MAVVIKNLKVHFGNLNLLLRKNAIWFEPLAQKEEMSKQIVGAPYDKY